MPSEPEFLCFFIDHRSVAVSELGLLLQTMESRVQNVDTSDANLATCQRFEYYVYGTDLPLPIRRFGAIAAAARVTTGTYNLLRRLIAISCGSESLLLGEKFITEQLARSFEHVAPYHPLELVAKEALSAAQEIRKQFSFFATTDYGDIAYELLGGRLLSNAPCPPILLAIGSGMLGRAIALHAGTASYQQIVAVSRWPKELKKKLGKASVLCVHPEKLSTILSSWRFDALLSLSNITPDYRLLLEGTLSSPNCRATVDFSTAPIFGETRPSNYLHEYDAAMPLLNI